MVKSLAKESATASTAIAVGATTAKDGVCMKKKQKACPQVPLTKDSWYEHPSRVHVANVKYMVAHSGYSFAPNEMAKGEAADTSTSVVSRK